MATVLGIIGFLTWTWIETPTATFFAGTGKDVGGFGPIEINFSQPMLSASVLSHLTISPPISGRFEWQSQTLHIWPEGALQPGTIIQATLRPGAASINGRITLFPIGWTVMVRQPQVVYLTHLKEGAEIGLAGETGSIQLTHTSGKVDGMAVSRDGNQIAYSVKKGSSGADLWVVDRNGKEERLMLDCGGDLCSDPSWSPDGERIAFTRKTIQPASSAALGGRIWLLDVISRQVDPLYPDPGITGNGPSWSPDGERLAFFDEHAGGVRIFNLINHQEQLFATSEAQAGCWSNDGQQMLLNDIVTSNSTPYESMFVVVFSGQPAKPLAGPVPEAEDINLSVPALSPDGQWIAVGLNFNDGPASSQLWLEKMDGTGAKAITTNQVFTQAAYHWDPTSQKLVFQRLELGTSQANPEVVVWDRVTGNFTIIDQDAGRPEWLP